MKKLLSLFLLFPLLSMSQGIKFEQGLTWEQIKQKAKTENKYIFVDCYTTWCAPCKAMEKNVYPLKNVGDFYNDKFISVKAQMDTSKNDGEYVKKWYADADLIESEYQIHAYPTFLYLSPEAKLLHKYSGGLEENGFIQLGIDALNPQKQYYSLLDAYKNGKRDSSVVRQLALYAKVFGEDSLAETMATEILNTFNENGLLTTDDLQFLGKFPKNVKAKSVVSKYIQKLTKKEILVKSVIELIQKFTTSSNDPGFEIFYRHEKKIDKLMANEKQLVSKHFARLLIEDIIKKEDIDPVLEKAAKSNTYIPEWENLYFSISKKYKSQYAKRVIAFAKVRFYYSKQDWVKYVKSMLIWVKGSDEMNNIWFINECAWSIFEYATDKKDLVTAVSWMDHIVKLQNETDMLYYYSLDTYANLLYKLGRKQEAISWQEKSINPEHASFKDNSKRLEKMKQGIPTWSNR